MAAGIVGRVLTFVETCNRLISSKLGGTFVKTNEQVITGKRVITGSRNRRLVF